MKRKHLALLTLLLSQSTSLWGMTNEDNPPRNSPQRPTQNQQSNRQNNANADLVQLQEDIHSIRERVKNTLSQNQAQESVIFLGPTGSGKTTLINLLAGRNFRAEKVETKSGLDAIKPICLNPLPEFSPNANNGVGTTLPTAWRDNNGPVFWDCPGFGDPRGARADIVNAFTIRETFKGKLKLLLIAEESFITNNRATQFLRLIKEATDILPNDQELAKSLSIVVTKQEKLRNPYTYISNQILTLPEDQQSNLTPRVRRFLELLVNPRTSRRISLIPSPTVEGNYTPDLSSLRESLRTMTGAVNPRTNLVVSNEAKLLASNYAQTFNTQISDLIKNEGKKDIVRYCNAKINSHNGTSGQLRETIIDIKGYLNSFKNALSELLVTQENNLGTTLNTLFTAQVNKLLPTITTPIKKKIEALFFLKNIRPEVSYNVGAWQNSCSLLVNKIEPLTKEPEVQVNQGTLTFKGIVVGTSDVTQGLRTHQQRNITNINVFGLNTLLIDQDLTKPGVSLNLFAPRWIVIGNKKINLNGATGTNGTHGTCGNSPGASGGDGQPGGPGGNGGNFYGKGEKLYGLARLRVNTNGGKGGNGGNGHKGRDGANGKDGDLGKKRLQQKEIIHPNLKKDAELMKIMFNASYEKSDFTTIENIYSHNDLGKDGQPGGNGGRGGDGGVGGHAGYSVIDGYNSWTPTCSHGVSGTNGIVGQGGKGGQHGRHCKGTLITGRMKEESYQVPRIAQKAPGFLHFIPGVNLVVAVGELANEIDVLVNPTNTEYKLVPQPDSWTVALGYKDKRGSVSDGKQGSGFNKNGQKNPPPKKILNREEILPIYRGYYQQQPNANPTISEFVRSFPNLNQHN